MRVLLSLTVVLSLAAASTSAADLEKMDLSIRKLPVLRSETPRYCLLVFGPEAKTRVWLVVDDKRLYIDLNANGDLTEPGESIDNEYRHFTIDRIRETDGKTTHTNLQIRGGAPTANIDIKLHGRLVQRAFRDARGNLAFGNDPRTAPIVHFNGPITLDQFWVQRPLSAARAQRLSVVVGTPGIGPGTFAIHPCDCFLTGGAAPEADIEFPHRDPGQPPIRMHVDLDRD